MRRFRRFILLLGLILIGTPILTLIFVLSYFYINQESLKREIVQFVNDTVPGKIEIEEIDLSLFRKFPDVSLKCTNAIFLGPTQDHASGDANKVFAAEQIFVSMNLRSLLERKVIINELTMSHGDFYIKIFDDSTINLGKAIGQSNKGPALSDEPQNQNQIDFKMNEFHMEDMRVHLENQVLGTQWHCLLDFQAVFGYSNNIITSYNTIDIHGFYFEIDKQIIEENLNLSIVNDLEINLTENIYRTNSKINFNQIETRISGSYKLDEDMLEMQFLIDHSDFGKLLSKAIWNQEFDLPEDDSGSIRMDGSIIGPVISNFPIVEITMTGDNIRFENPKGKGAIKNISFAAKVNSGKGPKFTDGHIELEHFTANFPAGLLQAKGNISNFQNPKFQLAIDAIIDLDGLDRMVRSKIIDSLQGNLNIEVDLRGGLDLVEQELLMISGKASLTMDDVSMYFLAYDYGLDNVSGRLIFENRQVELDSIVFSKGRSHLRLNGTISHPLNYLLGYQTSLEADIKLSSDLLDMRDVFQVDTTLGNLMGEELTDLNINLKIKTDNKGINNVGLLPLGSVEITGLSVNVRNKTSLKEISGILDIKPDTIRLSNLRGYKDSTDFILGGEIVNYNALSQSDSFSDIILNFDVEGDQLRFKDFFQIEGKDFIPPPYNTETIRNYRGAGTIVISNQEFLGQKSEFGLVIHNLSGTFVNNPLEFRNFNVDLGIKKDTLMINKLEGVIGDSDFSVSGFIVDTSEPEDSTLKVKDLRGKIKLTSRKLDLNQLIDIPIPEYQDKALTSISRQYPELAWDISIGELNYYNYHPRDITGKFQIHKPNQVVLDKLEYSMPAGTVVLKGHADLSDSTFVRIEGTIEAQGIDLSKINFALVYDGDSIRVKDHFAGTFNGYFNSSLKVYLDGKVVLNDLSLTLDGSLESGRIMDFPPLLALGDYFGNKDLSDVHFARIDNTIYIRDNQIQIPKMEISSTLGFMRIEGSQDFDGNLNYRVEVPFKLVKSVIWNQLVNRKRKENAANDEIQTFDGKKYVILRIGGTLDEPDIRIGKGREK